MKIISNVLLAVLLSASLAVAASYAGSAADATTSVEGGGITVKVSYLEQTAHESRFLIALDTHSVNLDAYDLKFLAVMRDDTGLVMQPTGAEYKGSGHHREVVLTFPRPSNERKWVEVVIKDIAGVKERVFRWDRQ